ncbi:MAG: TcpQ domain-containing protein [Burkholderiales bacterium]
MSAATETPLEVIPEKFRPDARQLPVPQYRPAAPQAAGLQKWEIRVTDITLAKSFERWAAAAGYRLRWDASRNFLVGAPDTFDGSLEDAIGKVLSSPGIRNSDYPLEVCIYANTPPLIRVTRAGDQANDCPSDSK